MLMMSLSEREVCQRLSTRLYVVFPRPSRSILANLFLIDTELHTTAQKEGEPQFSSSCGKKDGGENGRMSDGNLSR